MSNTIPKELLERAIRSNKPELVAKVREYLDLLASPYYSFVPRPDNPAELDQQTSFVEDQFPGLACALGGNGSGKSEAAAYKVARFLRTTPPPRQQTPYWVISQNLDMAAGVCWGEKLSRYLPPELIAGTTWHSQERKLPSAVVLHPHANGNRWIVEIKSYDMDRKRLQGASIGGFWADEAGPHSVIMELWARCRDYDFPGSKLYTLTPLSPVPELQAIYDNRDAHPDWRFYRLNSRCNATLAPGFIDRYIRSEIPELRETRLTGAFSALGGLAFRREWFRTYGQDDAHYQLGALTVKKADCTRLGTVDLAISLKASADYTSAQLWDISPYGHMMLVDEWHERAEGPEIVKALQRLHGKYNPSFWGVEDVAYQRLMIQLLRQHGLPVRALSTEGQDKLARSQRAQVKAESGQVYIPGTPWAQDWLAEILQFPNGAKDDRADSFSYSAILAAKLPVRPIPIPETDEERDKRLRQEYDQRMRTALLADSD